MQETSESTHSCAGRRNFIDRGNINGKGTRPGRKMAAGIGDQYEEVNSQSNLTVIRGIHN